MIAKLEFGDTGEKIKPGATRKRVLRNLKTCRRDFKTAL